MIHQSLFEQLPVLVLSLVAVAVVLLSVQAGFRLAMRRRASTSGEQAKVEGIGAVVGALFGLLAFMLAFTFGLAATRREVRKDLLLEEVNSIGTTFLRAGLIPEPHCREVRQALRQYVDLRLDIAEHPENLAADIAEAKLLQQILWTHAENLAAADLKNPPIAALFIDALNQTIDLQTKRITVGNYRIPGVVWLAFVTLTILATMSLGYNFGVQSGVANWAVALMLACSFSVVASLIFDLDRGPEGWLKLNQQPMYELRQDMGP